MILAGVDIGGTKCAVCVGDLSNSQVKILGKRRFPTQEYPAQVLDEIIAHLKELIAEYGTPRAIGISCGGPLDSRLGLILSPPNLPRWDQVDVMTPIREAFCAPVALQNDANACALAEWRWGAGRGYRNVIFLTFGTGMGAGLILNGKLYTGANDMAGEVGHIRLEKDGPIGHNKAGSFEGFCSGGGIAQIARKLAEAALDRGATPAYCRTRADLSSVTAEKVGISAQQGDPIAVEVFTVVARQLGRGLAILVDILNPDRIVIGSIFHRQRSLLEPTMMETLRAEALSRSLAACQVVASELGENVGDIGSLAAALQAVDD